MESNRSNLLTKPILRLESREDFARIPEPLRAAICQQLGVKWNINNFDIKVIAEDEKYNQHYIRRINAVNNGAQFLLDSLLTDKNYNREDIKKLKHTLNETTKHCCNYLERLGSHEIAHFQNSLAHFSDVIITTLSTILKFSPDSIKAQIDRAEQFATANQTRPAVCTITTRSGLVGHDHYIVQIDQPINPFTPELLKDINEIKKQYSAPVIELDELPEWFTDLNKDDKRLLLHFLLQHDIADFGDVINSISSKLRIIPAPANYGQHTLITLFPDKENQLQLTVHAPEFRSSHIASRDVSKMSQAVRDTHAYRNLKKEIEDAIDSQTVRLLKREEKTGITIPENPVIPILFQTLITPMKNPDSSLHADRTRAITAINEDLGEIEKNSMIKPYLPLITCNHPLNYGRWLTPTNSGSETAESIANLILIIRADDNKLTLDNPDNKPFLDEACKILEDCTNNLLGAGYSYRELYLSSLEQLLISECGGISIGSCVSGKDRKAIEIIHTDALKIYFALHHKIPPLAANSHKDKQSMDEFAQIFADIYCTKHQMALADFNAPGSFGVKTPKMYLPEHLQHAIHDWYRLRGHDNTIYKIAASYDLLKESDIMASNNEVKHFKKRDLSANKADLSWKSTSLAIHEHHPIDDVIPAIHEHYPIEHVINMALMATQKHIDARDTRIGLFAQTNGSDAERCHAEVCKQLLSDSDLTDFQKVAVILALISSTKFGENLITDMVNMMGYNNTNIATKTLSDYLTISAKQLSMEKMNPVDCITVIQDLLGKLDSIDQIEHCAANIKTQINLLKLDSGQSPTLNN